MILPPTVTIYIGLPMMGLGILLGLWALLGWLKLQHLKKLVSIRIATKFVRADFNAVGMSSPYIDFYFNVHSNLSRRIVLTGKKRGELWNPHIEEWKSDWSIDTDYQKSIMPDTNTEIRIRWYICQGHHSPMSEFAFRATDTPPTQELTFEDMYLEVKSHVLRFESNVGWLQLPQSVKVDVPDHPAFAKTRRSYKRNQDL